MNWVPKPVSSIPPRSRLFPAIHEEGPAPLLGLRVDRGFDQGIGEATGDGWAKSRLGAAGATLVYQDDVVPCRERVRCLVGGVDGQRAAWAATHVHDRLGCGRLMLAADDNDGELVTSRFGVGVVARHIHHAASQPGRHVRRDVRQRARRVGEGGRGRLAAGTVHHRVADHRHRDA